MLKSYGAEYQLIVYVYNIIPVIGDYLFLQDNASIHVKRDKKEQKQNVLK